MQLELLAKQAELSAAQPELEHGTHVKGVLPGWDLVSWLTRLIVAGKLTTPPDTSETFTHDDSPTSGRIHA